MTVTRQDGIALKGAMSRQLFLFWVHFSLKSLLSCLNDAQNIPDKLLGELKQSATHKFFGIFC